MTDVHVVRHKGAWALEVAGDKQDFFGIKGDAIRRGRQLAEQTNGRLIIHDDGTSDAHPAHDPPAQPRNSA